MVTPRLLGYPIDNLGSNRIGHIYQWPPSAAHMLTEPHKTYMLSLSATMTATSGPPQSLSLFALGKLVQRRLAAAPSEGGLQN